MAAAPGKAGLGEHGSWDWRQQKQPSSADKDGDGDESQKQYAPAASRNEGPILAALTEQLMRAAAEDDEGESDTPRCLLEVACGTGQHAAAFSRALIASAGDGSGLLDTYAPTDLAGANSFASVRAHARGVPGLLPPRCLSCWGWCMCRVAPDPRSFRWVAAPTASPPAS